MILPIVLVAAGGAALAVLLLARGDRPVPQHEPEEPPMPGKTGYKRVDAILDELKGAAAASGVPLGLLVGWVAKESGGKLGEVTAKYDERGYFQLMPDESKSLGLDHQRLSIDPVYSINAGLLLVGKYMRAADALGVAEKGTPYYWSLVKLEHTMGSGATKKIVEGAKAAKQAGTWEALARHAVENDAAYLSSTKHSPKKWFPFVDAVRRVGEPFGFGRDPIAVVGGGYTAPVGPVLDDIVDPLDAIQPRSPRS